MNTYIIIPAFNESSGLALVLESLLPLNFGIIVIDDGSTDDTGKIAGAFPVLLIRHELNLGQGAALETGMEAARKLNADFVIHFDADGQHDPSDITELLIPLQKKQILFLVPGFSEKSQPVWVFQRKSS